MKKIVCEKCRNPVSLKDECCKHCGSKFLQDMKNEEEYEPFVEGSLEKGGKSLMYNNGVYSFFLDGGEENPGLVVECSIRKNTSGFFEVIDVYVMGDVVPILGEFVVSKLQEGVVMTEEEMDRFYADWKNIEGFCVDSFADTSKMSKKAEAIFYNKFCRPGIYIVPPNHFAIDPLFFNKVELIYVKDNMKKAFKAAGFLVGDWVYNDNIKKWVISITDVYDRDNEM